MSRIKIIFSLIFVIQPLLLNGCFIDEEMDCRMHFTITIVNLADNTVKVVPTKNGRFSSEVKSFSINEAILEPSSAVTLEVDYSWVGSNNCAVDCIDKDWNGHLFEVSFMRGDSLIEKRRIVPCKPCDRPADKMVTICDDCVEEFADTIYYGR
jgi:hypothetical protein